MLLLNLKKLMLFLRNDIRLLLRKVLYRNAKIRYFHKIKEKTFKRYDLIIQILLIITHQLLHHHKTPQLLLFNHMRKLLSTTTSLPIRYAFSNPFFSKLQTPSSKDSKQQTNTDRVNEARNERKEALTELVNKINDANKYFLGVKLNTNYLKVNKVVQYEEIAKLTADKVTISDLPFEISKKQLDDDSFDKTSQATALSQKSAQVAFSRARLEPTLNEMRRIMQQFIINAAKRGRMSNVEPNFEMQCIKTFNSLDQKIKVSLTNEEALPQVKIKSVTLLKGLSAYRNDNYSTDSYEKDERELADGIITYKLYRQLKEEYPETEWFSTKRINARFELLVKGGPVLSLLDSGNPIGSTANLVHSVVIETDLLPPPPNAEHLLSADEFLRSYRLDYKSLLLTNFDRKNQFYPLTFSEVEKKTVLVNRIT